MINNHYPKGAVWRKWDLHVHTPFSVYQKYGEDNEETWESYIQDLEKLPEEFSVIGINDYLFIDGYKKLINEQQQNGRLSKLKLLPVIEFRIEKFAGVQFRDLKRINLHVIFSDEVSVETIQSQFLNTLEQSYTLESGKTWSRAITPESLKELGAEIKKGVPAEQLHKYGSDLMEGFNNLNVKEDKIFDALKKDCFEGKHLIAIGKTEWAELKWTDASIATKKSIINKADIVFTSAESVEKFIKAKSQLTQQGVNDLLLDCSDAHYLSSSEDKDRIGECFTWLKADPTFDGLKQAINEPLERVFVGDYPPLLERVSKNKTKYIKNLNITQVDGYSDKNHVWFKKVCIPFSSELVAVIGNKGSGKSAIADILSLCSNYHDNNDFSFLTPNKFRAKNGRLAKNFEAKITWESGNENTKNLNESPADTDVLEVKYLPQGRFERLTNEISSASEFQEEIESVVFSHIPETENLGALSFKELIERKTVAANEDIETLVSDVKDINSEIINLERKATDEYEAELKNKLKKKREELEALEEPAPISNPNEDPVKKQKHESINNRISDIRSEIEKIEGSIKTSESDKKRTINNIQKLNDVIYSIKQKKDEIASFIDEVSEKLFGFDVDIGKLISVEIDLSRLNKILKLEEKSLESSRLLLGEVENKDADEGNPDKKSLYDLLEGKKDLLKLEKGKLDSEQQAYQEYITAKADWEKDRQALLGASETPNTIHFFEAELDYLNETLPNQLEEKYEKRRDIARDIFNKKYEVVGVYKSARSKLNEIIAKNSDTLKNYKIEVDASLVKSSDFVPNFLGYILQNRMGSFHSKDGGEKEVAALASEVDFDDKNSVIDFLDKLMEAFRYDKRPGQNNMPRNIAQQVKDIQGLYDYLYSLSFLGYNYQLKQGDKELEQLSPGERGALLLVFYLLLDKNDIPLIIDQPEDNLDNHSVATVLVPFIRAAKQKRQIIMVTHNPNLAVVSDAEQVIYVNLDKENSYTFSMVSGSIENRVINQKIVEVLEGAMPAFNTRKRKYY
ncbi:TrlF family AAA-like ATPase [Kangiella shandongensis]|uniref:TrlF family AAA-like ATPase n=1 Tax=Kangiella shandongensis TaxID=2763258 RepID=UPI001CBCB0FE|nr:AAA family ATPase [Kangiella shandongensis]